MPQLAIAAVGAMAGSYAIGGTILGMSGAAIGWSVGSMLGSLLFAPDGPKAPLQDTRAAKIQFGARIGRPAGRVRLPLNPRWTSDWRAVERETGGKGGGGSEYFVYFADGLFWVADATQNIKLIAMTRLWNNGKLVWSALADSTAEDIENSNDQPLFSEVRFWDGDPAQMPWPVYEAAVGSVNADAHRRIACVSLENYGGATAPQWGLLEGEFITNGTQGQSRVYALWNFNDSAGSTAVTDTSVWGNDGTATAMQQSVDSAAFGATGMANTGTGGSSLSRTGMSVPWNPSTQGHTAEGRMRIGVNPNVTQFTIGQVTIGGDAALRLWVNDDLSPDLNSLVLTGFGESVVGATYTGPDEYCLPLGSRFHWAIDWDPETNTAVAKINGDVVLTLVVAGAVPGASTIAAVESGTIGSNVNAGNIEVDAVRFAADLRFYPGATGPSDSEPRADEGLWTPGPEDLQDVADSEMARCRSVGGWYDNGELAGRDVEGIVFNSSASDSMQQLATRHFFGATCRDQIYTRMRGSASVVTIPNADTGCALDQPGDPFTGVEIPDGLEVPRKWVISSPDIDADFDTGSEESDRVVTSSIEVREVQLMSVMTPAQRKGLANALATDAFLSAHSGTVMRSDKYAQLEPCDVYHVHTRDGLLQRVRMERQQYADGVSTDEVVLDDATALPEDGQTSAPYEPATTVPGTGSVEGILIDGSIARDADDDHGLYWATDFEDGAMAASLYRSTDDVSYAEASRSTSDAVTGEATTALGDWLGGWLRDDMNKVRVVVSGPLTSSTDAAVLADETVNAFALGAHGRWEYGQFLDATLISSGGGSYTYDLGRILRGRRGTEHAMGSHEAGDTFVLMRLAGLRRVAMGSGEIGMPRYWKHVPAGRLSTLMPSEELTNTGEGRKPRSGVHAAVARDGSDNATVTWMRRSRLSCRLTGTAGISCPLGESSEAYEVDIYEDDTFATVVRTIAGLSDESADYSAAEQTADGLTPGDPINGRIYQISETVGRGHALEFTL